MAILNRHRASATDFASNATNLNRVPMCDACRDSIGTTFFVKTDAGVHDFPRYFSTVRLLFPPMGYNRERILRRFEVRPISLTLFV